MTPPELIRIKREGGALTREQIAAFIEGVADDSWSEGQVAAMAMAVCLRGMDADETVALTLAMAHSGPTLRWDDANLPGPVLDKHATGGIGDKVSLLLAPIVAACGGIVPMVSGRGLGHTGGTLDKLQALPGYEINPSRERLLATLHSAGCAIFGASQTLAPADRRLYAIRDVTATVESLPLMTASILSKKLAAGLQALVLDVKVGSGAFAPTLEQARSLARSLVQVAARAGLPARALVTDMNQVLGHDAGNALEVQEALRYLDGTQHEPRLHEVTMALAAHLLQLGGIEGSVAAARLRAQRALESGAAAECFARMVAGLGGPKDVWRDAGLAHAAVQREVPAPRSGVIASVDVRALGLAIVALGGGRRMASDRIDPSVGLARVVAPGRRLQAGEPLATVHAASAAAAQAAAQAVVAALRFAPDGEPPVPATPVLLERIDAE